MSVIEIKDRDDLRAGDVATFAFQGHQFSGPLWGEGRALRLGLAVVIYDDGEWNEMLTLVSAMRKVPGLPTEPGSVILVTECRGERTDEPVVAWWDDVEAYWLTPTHRFGGMTTHDARDFTAWTPGKVVPA